MRAKASLSLMLTAGALATALVVAIAAWMGWANAQRRHVANSELAALAVRHAAAEAALRRAEARVAAARDGRTTSEGTVEVAARAGLPVQVSRAASRRPAAREDFSRLIEATRNHPAVEVADHAAHRAQLAWTYAALFRQLGLTEAQAERFTDTLMLRIAQHRDLLMAARSLRISDYDSAVLKLDAAGNETYLAAQRELLGEAGVREMQNYDDTIYARSIAVGVAGMTAVANTPMTMAQVRQLTEIIVRATGPAPPGPFPARIDIDWGRVDAEARAVLTERQAEMFRTMEAPGIGRGGARFSVRMNHVIMETNRADITGGDANAGAGDGGAR